ncbi:tetratricopeptide repeat protein [Microbulbifer agarilyticus]|uniref:tetratricopeptide repeat protein n=1 Tax=Microbulbifer agarilyticus TaxID=260552 RepID=UPI001CD46ECE|nr:tetratricopeptide repeat protein [Microbulbifer agarilyticus]MCA0893315.1 tetratricopeptide repeat protein [Microbulbifer agarilyticus]
MQRINRNLRTCAALLALGALLLSGCASNPGAPDEGAATSTMAEGESSKRVASPNPYLSEAPGVPSGAQQALANARGYFEQQQFAAAETELQQVVSQWPELSGAWLNLAKVQLKLEQPEQAEQSLQQAVTANAKNVFAWNSLGVLLRDQGRFDEAREAYQSALNQWPDFAMGHRNLGILFDLYLHKPEQALHHYREAQALEAEEDRMLKGWIMDLERRL